jgi:DNA polymerase family B
MDKLSVQASLDLQSTTIDPTIVVIHITSKYIGIGLLDSTRKNSGFHLKIASNIREFTEVQTMLFKFVEQSINSKQVVLSSNALSLFKPLLNKILYSKPKSNIINDICAFKNSLTSGTSYYIPSYSKVNELILLDIGDVLFEVKQLDFTTYRLSDALLELLAIHNNLELPFAFQSQLDSLTIAQNLNSLSKTEFSNYIVWSLHLFANLCDNNYKDWVDIRQRFSEFFKMELMDIITLPRPKLAEQVILLNESVESRTKLAGKATNKALERRDIKLLHDYEYPADCDRMVDQLMLKRGSVINLGESSISCGLGGLHSQHKEPISVCSDSNRIIIELDITSYYPNLIVQLLRAGATCPLPNLLPKMVTFLAERIRLKEASDKIGAQVYKIILNSIYGSTNYERSKLYSPNLTFSVTLNGQLIILNVLNLIISALHTKILWVNTDGFILTVEKAELNRLKEILEKCEQTYNIQFGTFKELKAVYIKNVNSYITLANDLSLNMRGWKSVEEPCCYELAVRELLVKSHKIIHYFDLHRLFTELKNPCDFTYISRQGFSKPIRYICSNEPEFLGGGLEIKTRNKIALNLTQSSKNPLDFPIDNVCIPFYISKFLEKASDFGIPCEGLKPYQIFAQFRSLLGSQEAASVEMYPLVKRAFFFANQGFCVAAGYGGKFVEDKHLPKSHIHYPIRHLIRNYLRENQAWSKASSIHAIGNENTKLLIIEVSETSIQSTDQQLWFYRFIELEFFHLKNTTTNDSSKQIYRFLIQFTNFENITLGLARSIFLKATKLAKSELKVQKSCVLYGNMRWEAATGQWALGGSRLYKVGTLNELSVSLRDPEKMAVNIVVEPSILVKPQNSSELLANKDDKKEFVVFKEQSKELIVYQVRRKPKDAHQVQSQTQKSSIVSKPDGLKDNEWSQYRSELLAECSSFLRHKHKLDLNPGEDKHSYMSTCEACGSKLILKYCLRTSMKESRDECSSSPNLYCENLSCTADLSGYNTELLMYYTAANKYISVLEPNEDAQTADTFEEVYTTLGVSCLEARPGSGKTYTACQHAITEALAGRIAILAFPTKRLLFQSAKILTEHLIPNTDHDKAMDIKVHTFIQETMEPIGKLIVFFQPELKLSKESEEHSNKPSAAAAQPLGKIHLTLHSYFRCMGDSPKLFSYMLLAHEYRDNIWLFIDELHLFIEGSARTIPQRRIHVIDSNFKKVVTSVKYLLSKDGESRKMELVNGYIGIKETHQGIMTMTDALMANKWEYDLSLNLSEPVLLSPTSMVQHIILDTNTTLLDRLSIFLSQEVEAFKNRSKKEKNLIDVPAWVRTWLNLSFNPTLISYHPYNRKLARPIDWVEFQTYLRNRSEANMLKGTDSPELEEALDAMNKYGQLIFPNRVPYNSDIICYNTLPIFIASQMRSSIMATATLSYLQRKVLTSSIQSNIGFFTIQNTQPKLDRLYVIFNDTNWFGQFELDFWSKLLNLTSKSPFYTLGFVNSFKEAKALYEFARNYTLPLGLLQGDSELSANSGPADLIYPRGFSESEVKTHVGSSHGVIGTGLNLPTRKLILVNANVFKPVSAYWYNTSSESFVKHQIEDLAHSVLQNIGRFARLTGEELEDSTIESRRVVVILGSEVHPGLRSVLMCILSSLFKEIQVMDSTAFEKDYASVRRDIKNSKFNEGPSLSDIRVSLVEEAINWLTYKNNNISLHEKFQSKLDTLVEIIRAEARSKPGGKLIWRNICINHNLYRITREQRETLKETLIQENLIMVKKKKKIT